MLVITDDVAPRAAHGEQSTLASVNKEIVMLVAELNSLVDEDFAIQETQRLLDFYTELNDEFNTRLQAFVNQLVELRQAYVTLNTKFRGNRARTMKRAQKLYDMLLKKYKRKAVETNSPLLPVEHWEIAQEFAVPVGVPPKPRAPRSPTMVTLSRKLFNAKHHYRARAHWTLARATAHKERVVALLAAEHAKHDDRERELRSLELSIATAKDQIEACRQQLVVNPPHHVWFDAYEAHANFVRQLLVHLHTRNPDVQAEHAAALAYGHVPGKVPSSVPSVVPTAAPRFVPSFGANVASNASIASVAGSSYRRMSGPDINDMPSLATVRPAQSTPLRTRPSFQVQFTGTLDRLFDQPMHIRYSKSVVDLHDVARPAMQGCGDRGFEPSTNSVPTNSVPFPSTTRPQREALAPMLAAQLQDVESYKFPLRTVSVSDDSSSVYEEVQGTPDTPDIHSADFKPEMNPEIGPLRVVRRREHV